MNFKALVVNWMGAGIGLVIVASGYAGISQNAEQIAKWIAPSYVGLSEEEIFKRSKIPCVRPADAASGCSYPVVETPESNGDEWQDRANAKLAELENVQKALAIQTPEYLHHEEYIEREVVPRRNLLIRWTSILFSLAAAGIIVHALRSLRTWCKTSTKTDIAQVMHKLFRLRWISSARGLAAGHKLKRIESDFQALRSLHQNGLISDEDFEQRKGALRALIDRG